MGVTAAPHTGFLFFLPLISVFQCRGGWSVTYTSPRICALEGSTVDISCTYSYPPVHLRVLRTMWLTQGSQADLRKDSKYLNRVRHHCSGNACTLTIRNVSESDSTVYSFRFITKDGGYTGSPGVKLTVTGLKATKTSYFNSEVWNCNSKCPLPSNFGYIWYKNGQKIPGKPSTLRLNSRDSYSCAAEGHEDVPSAPECGGQSCNRVIYFTRNVCAVEGSTVHISCVYENNQDIISQFWFSPGRSHRWLNSSQPEDLQIDPQFAGRIEESKQRSNRWSMSSLEITDVRLSDSAEYHFTFETQSFQWRSSLPGTTLTVTDPEMRVQVRRRSRYWADMDCSSPCALPTQSFIWYKNGQETTTTTSGYSGYFDSEDSVSCALSGHEDFPSPPLCVFGKKCNRVIYTERRICAAEGSSVEISCLYDSYETPAESKLWFSPEHIQRTQHWMGIMEDLQFAGRVDVFEREQGHSILSIRDLRKDDSAQYRFKFSTRSFEWTSSLPGTNLTVTALQVKVIRVHSSSTEAELQCHNSCHQAGRLSYAWFKNRRKLLVEDMSYRDRLSPGDIISCALKGQESHASPPVYILDTPSVSVSPSGEVMVGDPVTLTCSGGADPAAELTWYKDTNAVVSNESQHVFRSITPSDSGQYRCTAENEWGTTTSDIILIDVQYGPMRPSVSVSPSGEIMEGSSVTLTCSSDANPAANYTWYKENRTLCDGPEGFYDLSSVGPEDGGKYRCVAENRHGRASSSLSVDVQYGPKRPSVSVSLSGEIMEGSSVTLTCSSDANPAATYTWYKEGEDSPAASGQTFNISNVRADHSGNYHCEAQNRRGHEKTSVFLSVTRSSRASAVGASTAIILLLIFLFVFVFLRKKMSKRASAPVDRAGSREQRQQEDQGDLHYASVQFCPKPEESPYDNVSPARARGHVEEDGAAVVYSAVRFHRGVTAAEDADASYSTINQVG